MKRKIKVDLCLSIAFLLLFVIWTMLVCFIDVKNIGPNGSKVGLSSLNSFVKEHIGVNFLLYEITDWLGLVPILFVFSFAFIGLIQLIKRKSILKVDKNLIVLGVFYVCVFFIYVFFEKVVVNFRPVLINGYLEPSYPSSTTILSAFIMPTALMQLKERIKSNLFKKSITYAIILFILAMIIGRIASGVHWISDVVGGVNVSLGLVFTYRYVIKII